ncbi:hypothetical protein EC957_004957 [Mortierella hygrophila]|uniref:THIF-type NAD/FAD binding fold domain-containing protein n=1 Tax=Mortierella hygrophila TaxID=979708 RepID=A0A9P6F196_9FUNG|nr:hypothetical protein EC957_004957 [Mortierella hygrophila]
MSTAFNSASQSTKLVVVAAAASVATAAILLGYQGSQRKQRTRNLKDDLKRSATAADIKAQAQAGNSQSVSLAQATAAAPPHIDEKVEFDEELVLEQLARNIAFLGEEGVQKLRNSFVVVVGAGGIGSWAASMLIKSGVGKIRIIDYDQVSLPGLNQHATATRNDVGTPKAIAMKKAFRTIAPWVHVDAKVERLQEDSAAFLLSGNPDYVVDCIGDLSSKLDLLKYCFDNKIPVMSSMGAGAKADPSRVQICDISETFEDPLARAVRRRLKKLGVDTGIDVVFSSEKPYQAVPQPNSNINTSQHHSDDEKNGYSPLPNFPSGSALPVFGPLPAMFGMSMATFITCKIAGWAMDPFPNKNRTELYQRLHRDLKIQEEELAAKQGKTVTDIPLDRRDVGYVIEEIFRGGKSGLSQCMDRIAVCRWKREEPLSLTNVVVLTQREMERHMALPVGADLEKVYGKEAVAFVEGLFREEEQICRLR